MLEAAFYNASMKKCVEHILLKVNDCSRNDNRKIADWRIVKISSNIVSNETFLLNNKQ